MQEVLCLLVFRVSVFFEKKFIGAEDCAEFPVYRLPFYII